MSDAWIWFDAVFIVKIFNQSFIWIGMPIYCNTQLGKLEMVNCHKVKSLWIFHDLTVLGLVTQDFISSQTSYNFGNTFIHILLYSQKNYQLPLSQNTQRVLQKNQIKIIKLFQVGMLGYYWYRSPELEYDFFDFLKFIIWKSQAILDFQTLHFMETTTIRVNIYKLKTECFLLINALKGWKNLCF